LNFVAGCNNRFFPVERERIGSKKSSDFGLNSSQGATMTPMESYLADLSAVRGAGTAETSGYPALAKSVQ